MFGSVLAILLSVPGPLEKAGALLFEAPPRLLLELALEVPELSVRNLALGESDSSAAPNPESPKPVGWMVAGAVGGVPVGALALGFAGASIGSSRDPPGASGVHSAALAGYYVGAGVGTILGGVGGYFLGKLARNGSVAAKIGVVALDVLGLPSLCFDVLLPLSASISGSG